MATRKTEAIDRKELHIGMLGYGFMGKCHSHAFKVIPYIYPEANILPRLLIICGRNEEKVRREAGRYGFDEYCTDWQDLVLDRRIDVFYNCGPDPVHPEPCIAALENGKHVICEKPLAVSVEVNVCGTRAEGGSSGVGGAAGGLVGEGVAAVVVGVGGVAFDPLPADFVELMQAVELFP